MRRRRRRIGNLGVGEFEILGGVCGDLVVGVVGVAGAGIVGAVGAVGIEDIEGVEDIESVEGVESVDVVELGGAVGLVGLVDWQLDALDESCTSLDEGLRPAFRYSQHQG